MMLKNSFITILLLIILSACNGNKEKKEGSKASANEVAIDSAALEQARLDSIAKEEEAFKLTDENAIEFFFEYSKKHKEDKVKVTTQYGSFIIDLFEETPYHRANFIYLTKKGYFNGTYFHRVVKDFIIQGGNSDEWEIANRRKEIGSYLLPPDTKKGFKHHRGVVSMPSSEVDNPHKFASPYEFFIVCSNPGSYHLDGDFTAFGRVVEGMDVVDKINNLPTDAGEWPLENASMTVEIIE
ncbi:peptidylprolyl isomerase [Zhouia amylolytica]|uniref:Peptidyl-prolyl cis-trans isomerase n=1 Tax=Zhouia amylolytica AD3 TaxID=1286632 RepID=W2USR9_9FLAO|nr:cyclophilin type peptidyl-prolyl cis-trans isomerase [Zhouia amylolytica AD3]